MSGPVVESGEMVPVEPAELKKPQYKRVLVKLSGEALMGTNNFGIDSEVAQDISSQVIAVHRLGVEIAIVVGGGNIIRGVSASEMGFDRTTGDYMGMLATVINALALQNALEKNGIFTRVLSAIHMQEVAEPFITRRAIRHLEKKRVVIFAAGTGNPYFSTDTAAALRAMEVRSEIILKATKVDGVYDKDPNLHAGAQMFDTLTYLQVLQKGLKVMDTTAISLCMDHDMPILVFNLHRAGSIQDAVMGRSVGTLIKNSEKVGTMGPP